MVKPNGRQGNLGDAQSIDEWMRKKLAENETVRARLPACLWQLFLRCVAEFRSCVPFPPADFRLLRDPLPPFPGLASRISTPSCAWHRKPNISLTPAGLGNERGYDV